LSGAGFDLAALAVIGLAAFVAGAKLFPLGCRSAYQQVRGGMGGIGAGLLARRWRGSVVKRGDLKPVTASNEPLESITSAQIDSISYERD